MSVEVMVLGGLFITVEYDMAPADPSVGIFHPYAESWYITHIADRPLRKNEKADWLYRRIEKAGENERVEMACNEHYDERDY